MSPAPMRTASCLLSSEAIPSEGMVKPNSATATTRIAKKSASNFPRIIGTPSKECTFAHIYTLHKLWLKVFSGEVGERKKTFSAASDGCAAKLPQTGRRYKRTDSPTAGTAH